VVIVAGYCGEPATEEHRTLMKGAFRDFDGTILSGGTEAGISGLVGELQATCGETLRTIGYVPARVPPDVPLDVRYTECRRTMGTDFSPLEPLQYWADLLASGIPADQIRLLALGGGRIAASECLMALAFGVPVGVVEKGGSEASRYLAETPWALHPGLQRLRAEPGALVRFLMARDRLGAIDLPPLISPRHGP
jgi:hypothetical protein